MSNQIEDDEIERRDTQKTQHGIETKQAPSHGGLTRRRDTQKTQHGIETVTTPQR